jgi:DNA-binding NarL/FixJ family response regulator
VPAIARASVLVVDDHVLVRTVVANIISHEPDLHVVAEAANGLEALDAFDRYHPDVTLLDLRMPILEGVETVRRMCERDPNARVIVLRTYDTDEDIARALQAGAKAYVLKDISAAALVACIHDVPAGKTQLAPAAAAKLAERITQVQAHAARARRAAADGGRAVGQGDRQHARNQRASGQDPPRTSLRKARRDQPHRCREGRLATGTGQTRLDALTSFARRRMSKLKLGPTYE